MSLVTHLPTIAYGHNAIDPLSKFTYFISCKHTVSAANLAQLLLENVVAHHGLPALTVSNHDPWFTSCFQHSLISTLGCQHFLSMAFQPEMDGLSKRMQRSIEQVLYCYISAQQGNWDLLLPTCEFALNSTFSASIGISPAYVVLGYEPTLPLEHAVYAVSDGIVQSAIDYIANMQSTIQLVYSTVTRLTAYMVIILIDIVTRSPLLWNPMLGYLQIT